MEGTIYICFIRTTNFVGTLSCFCLLQEPRELRVQDIQVKKTEKQNLFCCHYSLHIVTKTFIQEQGGNSLPPPPFPA
jgi:hypothetical protein